MICVEVSRVAGMRATIRGMKKGQRRKVRGDDVFTATGNGHGEVKTAPKLLLGFRGADGKEYPPFDLWEVFRNHYMMKTSKNNAQLTESRFRAIKGNMPSAIGVIMQGGRPIGIDMDDLRTWCSKL